MNKMPKNVSKLVMGLASSCVLVSQCHACGPSLGYGGFVLLLIVLALAAAVPIGVSTAGMIAAVRAHREGVSLWKGFVGLAALAFEAGMARLFGPESLIGVLSVGLGGLQVALFAMALMNGRGSAPLPGQVTILSRQALGL